MLTLWTIGHSREIRRRLRRLNVLNPICHLPEMGWTLPTLDLLSVLFVLCFVSPPVNPRWDSCFLS